jgi:hypothetical protein
MRPLIATCVILALAFAGAWSMPSDAQLVLTADDGTIVGVGHAETGTHFEFELLAGFEGPARLLIVEPTGDALLFDAFVSGGAVFVDVSDDTGRVDPIDPADMVDLALVLEASGFVAFAIVAREAGADGRAVAASARDGSPADARPDMDALGGPDDRASERAREALEAAGEAGQGDDEERPDPPVPPASGRR